MEESKIEWTDHTFNPWTGCTKVSANFKEGFFVTMCRTLQFKNQFPRFGEYAEGMCLHHYLSIIIDYIGICETSPSISLSISPSIDFKRIMRKNRDDLLIADADTKKTSFPIQRRRPHNLPDNVKTRGDDR